MGRVGNSFEPHMGNIVALDIEIEPYVSYNLHDIIEKSYLWCGGSRILVEAYDEGESLSRCDHNLRIKVS